MIQAILNGNRWLVPAVAALSFALALPSFYLGRRRGRSGALSALTAMALACELVATLYPTSPGAPASATCFIERDVITSTFTTQGLLNVVMYIPLAAVATWLTRRPLPVALGCVLLSAVTETMQALVPGIGRSCDSADLWANSLGAVIACTAASAALHWATKRRPAVRGILISRDEARRCLSWFAAGIGALGVVSALTVTFVMAEVAWANTADDAQKNAAEQVMKEFFDQPVHLVRVQFFPGPEGGQGRISANADKGVIELDWPSREVTSGLLQPPSPNIGPRAAPIRSQAAIEVATDFVREHFPWALSGHVTATPAGPLNASSTVAWRSRRDGVLMPMRMDVLIGPDAKVVSFTARHVADPALPSPQINRTQAEKIALGGPSREIVHSGELLARKDGAGNWRPYWRLSVGLPNATQPPESGSVSDTPEPEPSPASSLRIVMLDAVTGRIVAKPTDSDQGDS